ncbi:MAG: S9 family peptidase, partial [Pseudomonadales bacterium]|nr:S9 family peptidase [Pseudomonadales bacterium]
MKYILLLLVVLWSMQVHATTGPGLPADSVAATLTTLPAFRNLKLSPDGKRVLMLRARGETYHLTVLDTVARTNKLLLASDPEQFLFEWCSWANNERIVCSIRIDKVLNLAGYGKKQLRTEFTRLVAINADGTGYLQLVPEQKHSGNYRDSGWMSRVQSDIVSWLPDDDEHILLSLIRKDPFFPDVYKLNIYTNRMKLDTRHRSGILEWLADRQDRVRLGMGIEDGNLRVIVRDGDSSRFTERTPGFLLTDPEPGFAGFAEQEDQVYLFSNNGEDKSALWLFDLKTQRMVRKLLADDRYDVRGPLYTSERGRPLMMVRRREGAELYWFDHKLEAAFNEVAAALPGEKTLPVSVSAELDSLILKNSGEKMPDTYYYYDVARQQLIRIGADYDVAAGQLPERTIYSYKASDGLEIQAYLTLPLQGQGGLPTVIMPHGGPHARDTADFDYLSIVFAAAGYAVLQPDYRGSAGYGQRFRAAGYGQWGKRMQQDVLDGLDALIAE